MEDLYILPFFEGNIEGNSNLGGIIGYGDFNDQLGSSQPPEIINSYSKSIIRGDSAIGGLVGAGAIRIKNSYFNGTLIGTKKVSGCTGKAYTDVLQGSYCITSLDADSVNAPLSLQSKEIINSYFNTDSIMDQNNIWSNHSADFGLSFSQFQNPIDLNWSSTGLDIIGQSFSQPWVVNSNDYPKLYWEDSIPRTFYNNQDSSNTLSLKNHLAAKSIREDTAIFNLKGQMILIIKNGYYQYIDGLEPGPHIISSPKNKKIIINYR